MQYAQARKVKRGQRMLLAAKIFFRGGGAGNANITAGVKDNVTNLGLRELSRRRECWFQQSSAFDEPFGSRTNCLDDARNEKTTARTAQDSSGPIAKRDRGHDSLRVSDLHDGAPRLVDCIRRGHFIWPRNLEILRA